MACLPVPLILCIRACSCFVVWQAITQWGEVKAPGATGEMVIAELHWDVLLVSWLNGLHSGKKRITEIQKVHHMGFIGFCRRHAHAEHCCFLRNPKY
jgi:hypothetical protein